MKKLSIILIVAMLVIVMVAGCSTDSTSSGADTDSTSVVDTDSTGDADSSGDVVEDATDTDDGFMVGFSAGYQLVQHWKIEITGAMEAVEENGGTFVYTVANGDLQQQIADIENMVSMGIDMLIVGPCDSEGIVPTLEEIKRQGVAVMASDINVTGTDIVAYVASDNYQIGVDAANELAALIGEEGKIATIIWPAASATLDRENGFNDTIKNYPNIEVVATQDCSSDRNLALSATESILEANPDLKGIFGVNAESALGAYAATQSANRKEVAIVTVDSDGEVMQAIANDTNMKVTIAQDPYTMGYTAGLTAMDYLNGKDVADASIPTTLVTVDNTEAIIARDQEYLDRSTVN